MAREDLDDLDPRRPSADVTDTATRHQVYLERHAAKVANDARKQAQKMAAKTARLVQRLDRELSELDADELGDLLREAKRLNTQIMTDALADMVPSLEALAVYEGEFTARALKAATKRVKVLTLKASEAYAAALEKPLAATGEMLEPFLEDWTTRQVKAVNNLIGKGYTQGWTNQQMTTAIRGTKAAGYSDGIVANIGRNAEMVTRTAVQHVASTARAETWAKNSDIVTGYKIVATLDGNTTPQCRSLDGRVFEVGKGPMPPFHINCRTTTAPEVSEEFAFLDEGETRSSIDGPVDAKETYYSWLKKQPSEFQDDAIGPVRAQLFRDGGLTSEEFSRLNLGRNFQPLTLDEMRKKEPNAFKKAGL